jgi:hypothetical protein
LEGAFHAYLNARRDPELSGQLHLEGKTDQAKADLARLASVRKEREEAAAKRKAEQDGTNILHLLLKDVSDEVDYS